MNQRKQYMNKCSDIQQYKWSLGIFLKLFLTHWKYHLKRCALCLLLSNITWNSIYHHIKSRSTCVLPVSPV